jgi:hypothetical protein
VGRRARADQNAMKLHRPIKMCFRRHDAHSNLACVVSGGSLQASHPSESWSSGFIRREQRDCKSAQRSGNSKHRASSTTISLGGTHSALYSVNRTRMILIKTALDSYHSAAHIKQVIARDSQRLGLKDSHVQCDAYKSGSQFRHTGITAPVPRSV